MRSVQDEAPDISAGRAAPEGQMERVGRWYGIRNGLFLVLKDGDNEVEEIGMRCFCPMTEAESNCER